MEAIARVLKGWRKRPVGTPSIQAEVGMSILSTMSAFLMFLIAILMLMLRSWNFWSRERADKAEAQQEALVQEVLKNAYELRQLNDTFRKTEGDGETAFLMLGTYAAHQLPGVLDYYESMGLDVGVGGIFLAELARSVRQTTMRDINKRFHHRIIELDCPNLPGGFHGRTLEEALAIRRLWQKSVIEATTKWLDYLDRSTQHEVLVFFDSTAGHASLRDLTLGMYRQRHPDKPIYHITILDSRDVVRERFPLSRQSARKWVNGTIVTDNRRGRERFDRAVQMLLGAMSAGT